MYVRMYVLVKALLQVLYVEHRTRHAAECFIDLFV